MFKLCACIALVAVANAVNPQDAQAETRSFKSQPNAGDGSYAYGFETSNGIAQQESGIGGQSAQGSATWYSPEGAAIQLSYVADQFGYRATGNAIPTPPPIPEAIQRSLEYIRTHPSAESQPQQVSAPLPQFLPQLPQPVAAPQSAPVPQAFAAPQFIVSQPQQFSGFFPQFQ